MIEKENIELSVMDAGREIIKDTEWGQVPIRVLQSIIAPNAPTDQFIALLYLAKQLQLDPILKEIMLCQFDKKNNIWSVFVGVHGMTKQATRTKRYLYREDYFILANGETVKYETVPDYDKDVVASFVIGYFNHPTIEGEVVKFKGTARKDEYDPSVTKSMTVESPKHPWKSKRSIMLLKCAAMNMFREVGLTGYDEAEIPWANRNEKDITSQSTILDEDSKKLPEIRDNLTELKSNPKHRKLAINLYVIYQNDTPEARAKMISDYCQRFEWNWSKIEKNLFESGSGVEISQAVLDLIISKNYAVPTIVKIFDAHEWDMDKIEKAIKTHKNGQSEMFDKAGQ